MVRLARLLGCASAWCLVIMIFVSVSGAASGTDASQTGAIPSREKAAARFPRLDSGLNQILDSDDVLATAQRLGYRSRQGRIQVVIVTHDEGSAAFLQSWLEGSDATAISTAGKLVQAMVAPELLPLLDVHAEVLRVRRPRYIVTPQQQPARRASTQGSKAFTSEGVVGLNANIWHSAGYTGSGIKVGVIDGEFGGYAGLAGSELPPASLLHYQDYTGSGPDPDHVHGTACAEVIHDVAPDAELYLAHVATQVDIVNAVTYLSNNGVTVISMSLGWLSWGPGDGTGAISDAINSFVGSGGVWVNSAGNSRLAHWQGVWSDPDGDSALNLAEGVWINYVTVDGSNYALIPAGIDIYAALVWNDWDAASIDLDLYLYFWDGVNNPTEAARSSNYQTGAAGDLPVEDLYFKTEDEGYYGIAVGNYSNSPDVQLEYFTRFDTNPLAYSVPDGSITPPAGTANAIAVAALDAINYSLESYSSRGPANGPGGSLSGGIIKPDIASFANVSTTSYGERGITGGFGGTSSACPHVAGAAALVRSAYPSYSGAQVRSYLESSTVDMGPAGKDNDYGLGRLQLGSPPGGSCTVPGMPSTPSTSATHPQSGSSYTLSWSAGTRADSYQVQESTSTSFSAGTTSTYDVSGTSRSFSHTVASDTNFYYRVRSVRSCGASSSWTSSRAVTVIAGGGSGGYRYMVAGVASAPGSGSNYWKTYLSVGSYSAVSSNLTLIYRHSSGTVTRSRSLPAFGVLSWDNVASSLFGVGGSSSGAVEVQADIPVFVQARTYNDKPAGTFGQYLPGVQVAEMVTPAAKGYLGQLRNVSPFYTNVGFINPGSTACQVRIILRSSSGIQLGYSQTETIPAGSWKQLSNIFSRAQAGVAEVASASIEVLTQDGAVWAYASVVDGNSGDPTTIPVILIR